MGKLTTEKFISKAISVHGNLYRYEDVIYQDSKTKVTIVCKRHGVFLQQPSQHLRGRGCPACGREKTKQGQQRCNDSRRLSTDEIISRFTEVHGSKYGYGSVVYKDYKTPVSIKCELHGYFHQTPNKHIGGTGCPKCANKQVTTDEFIRKCREVHGDRYDYSKVIYRPGYSKVEIVCKEHGSFFQVTYNHLSNKQGCPECKHIKAKNNIGYFNELLFENNPEIKETQSWLYTIRCFNDSEVFVKIGITTQQDPKGRWYGIPYDIEIISLESMNLYDCFVKEQRLKQKLVQYRHMPVIKFNGHTECFSVDVLAHIL